VSDFKLQRCELFFKPAGSKDFISLGSCDAKDVLMTSAVSIGDRTLTQSFRPGALESMKTATNELAAFAIGERTYPVRSADQVDDD